MEKLLYYCVQALLGATGVWALVSVLGCSAKPPPLAVEGPPPVLAPVELEAWSRFMAGCTASDKWLDHPTCARAADEAIEYYRLRKPL